MRFNINFWTNATPTRKRIYSIAIMLALATLTMLIGSLVPLSSEEALELSDEFNQTIGQNIANPAFIFQNNFQWTLLMFVPLVGSFFGLFIMFSTGLVGGALVVAQGYPSYSVMLLVATPIFWLEFIPYSIAMAQSIWLFRRIFQLAKPGGRELGLRELKWTGIFIAICAGLLAVGAVVEVWLINLAGNLM